MYLTYSATYMYIHYERLNFKGLYYLHFGVQFSWNIDVFKKLKDKIPKLRIVVTIYVQDKRSLDTEVLQLMILEIPNKMLWKQKLGFKCKKKGKKRTMNCPNRNQNCQAQFIEVNL